MMTNHNNSFHKIVAALAASHQVLLIGHIDPDGDAIGALLGLDTALRRLGKSSTMATPNAIPSKYQFLHGSERITHNPAGTFDLCVALDCSDLQRLGDLYPAIIAPAAIPIINVDHHITNTRFGTLNWIEPTAVATAELVVHIVEKLGAPMDREQAMPLLVGIVSDTRGFRTPNTTSAALKIAGRLVDAGAPLDEVLERVINTRPYSTICLWGKMMQTAHLEERIAWAVLSPDMLAACGSTENGDGGFVNFLATAQEADVSVVFHDRGNGGIEIGLRSKPGISVAEIAVRFGGGGHPQAAGCTVQGPLDEVKTRVLGAIRAAIAHQSSKFQ